jgi:CDGSH-type Zn-finger protein
MKAENARTVPALWQYRRHAPRRNRRSRSYSMKISCRPNGPYVVDEEVSLRREDGTALRSAAGMALCRCGGSAKKPFCDGTHARNGFSDRNSADPAADRRIAHAGKSITIFDNRSMCAHAGFCTDRLKAVFRMGVEPWIDADAASVEEIIATVEKCPSGALSYAINGVDASPPRREPMVAVTNDGPYAVTGGIALDQDAGREHYTLCRCGGSKNKPFCDGTHWHIGFKDP